MFLQFIFTKWLMEDRCVIRRFGSCKVSELQRSKVSKKLVSFRTKNEEESHYNREVKFQGFRVAKRQSCCVKKFVSYWLKYFFLVIVF